MTHNSAVHQFVHIRTPVKKEHIAFLEPLQVSFVEIVSHAVTHQRKHFANITRVAAPAERCIRLDSAITRLCMISVKATWTQRPTRFLRTNVLLCWSQAKLSIAFVICPQSIKRRFEDKKYYKTVYF